MQGAWELIKETLSNLMVFGNLIELDTNDFITERLDTGGVSEES